MNLLFCNILSWNINTVVLHVMLQHIRYHWVVFKYPIKLAYEVVVWINTAGCLMAYPGTCRYGDGSVIAEVHRIVFTCSHCCNSPVVLRQHLKSVYIDIDYTIL